MYLYRQVTVEVVLARIWWRHSAIDPDIAGGKWCDHQVCNKAVLTPSSTNKSLLKIIVFQVIVFFHLWRVFAFKLDRFTDHLCLCVSIYVCMRACVCEPLQLATSIFAFRYIFIASRLRLSHTNHSVYVKWV